MLRGWFGQKRKVEAEIEWIHDCVHSAVMLEKRSRSLAELAEAARQRAFGARMHDDFDEIAWLEQLHEGVWVSIRVRWPRRGRRELTVLGGGDYDGLKLVDHDTGEISVSCQPPRNRPLGMYARRAADELSRRHGYYDGDALMTRINTKLRISPGAHRP